MLGRGRGRSGVGGGGGPKSAVTVKMRCVCSSSAKVRAPRRVVTFATTRNWLGPSSCTTVNVPSPFEENASAVPGSNAQPSTPAPIDPGTALAFSSNGDGTLTVVHEDGPSQF